jgi:protein-S-isoprenylcysteine O-methyltransferase Ste14
MDWSKIVFLIGVLMGALIRIYYQHFNTDDVNLRKSHVYISNLEILNLIGIILFGVIVPIIAHYYFPKANYNVPKNLQITGMILLVICLIVFQRSHADLDRQFSHTLIMKNNHKLIKTGIYRYVRHPMYSVALLGWLVNALLMPNYVSVCSFTVALMILFNIRIPEEEKMLVSEFGEEYKKYMHETCGLIPFICHFT